MRRTHLLALAILPLAAISLPGCSNKLTDERDSLMQQNQQLEQQIAAERQATAKARQRAYEWQAYAKTAATAPATQTAPTGLEGVRGVTQYTTSSGEQAIALEGDILFDLGKATIKPEFKQTLNRVAGVIKARYADRKLRIEGHTDWLRIRTAGWEDNWDLGAARARAVLLYLQSQGVAAGSMYIASFADTELKDTNDPAPNRRVEIVVVK